MSESRCQPECSKAHENLLIYQREGANPVKATVLAAKLQIAMLNEDMNMPSGRCEPFSEEKLTTWLWLFRVTSTLFKFHKSQMGT